MTYAPPPVPPVQPGGTVRRRGRIPLRLAAIFGVVGIALVVVGGVLLAKKSLGAVDDFQRVPIGGVHTVQFSRVGPYVGYYETPSDASHHAFVDLKMLGPSGQPVTIGFYGGHGSDSSSHLTYDVDGRHGEALYTFTVSQAGTYRVLVTSKDAAPGADLAFGKSIAGSLAVGVALLVPGILLVIAAIVLLIIGLVLRNRTPAVPQFPPPGYPGGYPPPPGYGYPPPPGYGYPPQPPPPGGWTPPTSLRKD